jgi:hypothetical protein
MGLEDYSAGGDGQQKQTHITFGNPDHPDMDPNYADEEAVRNHFRAANAIQDSSVDRKLIVGDFLVAVQQAVDNDDDEALTEFFESLTDE